MSQSRTVEDPGKAVRLLLPIPLSKTYTYHVPQSLRNYDKLQIGSLVRVAFSGKEHTALVRQVVNLEEVEGSFSLKDIKYIYDYAPLSSGFLKFFDFFSNYNMINPGQLLSMVLRNGSKPELFPQQEMLYFCGGDLLKAMSFVKTEAQKKVLVCFQKKEYWKRSALMREAGVSSSALDSLAKAGLLARCLRPMDPIVDRPSPDFSPYHLEGQQKCAAEFLQEKVKACVASVTLLDGVTGSGKTAVYFEAIAQALSEGKQVLILLPEIALTQQFLGRFRERFGTYPAQWHSGLSTKMREKIWQQITKGEIFVLAGARSALLLPFKNLGLIIIDEEHDISYKQEESAYYHARDMAIVRGKFCDFPVILASATPSVETMVNVLRKKYERVALSQRFQKHALPDLSLIDLSKEPLAKGEYFSPIFIDALQKNFQKGEQSLIFLNRRGYAPVSLCRQCGYQLRCRQCSTFLVYHQHKKIYLCHKCDYQESFEQPCLECGALEGFMHVGFGIERIAEYVADLLPEARCLIFSSDLIGSFSEVRKALEKIERGEIDIIIGTQMVTKGHHFPKLSLVGVMDVDFTLKNEDFRSGERVFQVLSQVTGRAGRAGLQSYGFIQTKQVDHPVLQAILHNDREGFYEKEIAERRSASLPPFGRLAALIISSEEAVAAENYARLIRRLAPLNEKVIILGPTAAPIALLRGFYRYRLLLKSSLDCVLQDYIKTLLRLLPNPGKKIRLKIDIDPQSFW